MSMSTTITSAVRRGLAAVAAIVTLCSIAACGSGASADGAFAGKLAVVASINQWGSIARDLGGDHVDVTAIMSKTNVEAHDYEPTAQDVARIGSAKIAIVNGADYDPWASKAVESTDTTLVDAAAAGGVKEGDNPHVWFSSKVRSAAADVITAAYSQADPSHKNDYEQLNKDWHAKEGKLESKIKETSATTKGLPYAATESVAWYLADDLGMTDVTPKGYAQASANESEPTAADIKAFQDALEDGSVKALVLNTQETNSTTDQITFAAKEGGVPVVELTEQMPHEYGDLIDWMDALVDDFASAAK